MSAAGDPGIGARPIVYDTPLNPPSRGIYVGQTGNVDITFANGTRETIPAVVPGSVLPFSVRQVNSAGTTVPAAQLKAID